MANLTLLACLTSDELRKLTEIMRKRNAARNVDALYADQELGFVALPLLRMAEDRFEPHREALISGRLRNILTQAILPKTTLIADNAALPVSAPSSEGYRKSRIHLSPTDFSSFRRYTENQAGELEMNRGSLPNEDNQLTLAVSTDANIQQVRLDSSLSLNVSNFILIEEPDTASGVEPSAYNYNNNDFTLGNNWSSDSIQQQLCPQGRVVTLYSRNADEDRYQEVQFTLLKEKIRRLKNICVDEPLNADIFDRQKFDQLAVFGQYCQRYINEHLAVITQYEVDRICDAIDISYQVATGKNIDSAKAPHDNPLERLYEIADDIMGKREHRIFAYSLMIMGATLLLGAIITASILLHPAIALIASNITVALFKGLGLVLGIVALTAGGIAGVAVGQAMFKQGNRNDFSLELNNFGVFCQKVEKTREKEEKQRSTRVGAASEDAVFFEPLRDDETHALLGAGGGKFKQG